ncbi:wax ester/triacylglycerol synthase family O-acyltransferase [Skermania piniformis]|uniref:Diacylglycerol O-acyltransferase n=1 Tax=Skermania pinensis TaxID=39122 RepID=A0ABX8SIJ8_9ACTN|nr:wax ester/triacylglycerol synthase family O-acyltransferase [Skermania piniformis]QXQ15511.1 wax ester/triacylglycerol synthase family O-acyltransferase [Skermania piniformis]
MAQTDSRRLPVIDGAYLHLESPATPMHVGSLQIFSIPDGAPGSLVADIVAAYRASSDLVAPFNLRLVHGPTTRAFPAVVPAESIDMEYHVRHTALPAPGGERQLGELISYLHGVTLDRSRPLWTCHVIEGLSDNRFAIYTKIHHALTDGVNGVRMCGNALADTPAGPSTAPWHNHRTVEHTAHVARKPAGLGPAEWARSLSAGVSGLLIRRGSDAVRRPFDAPTSVLNLPVTGARRVATQQVELARMQEVARLADVSVNDVFLAVCSGALRRHLLDEDVLPEAPLISGVPVSLRYEGEEGGNAAGMVWASLATDIADPMTRLKAINVSSSAAKNHLRSMPLPVRRLFTVLTAMPVTAVLITGLGATRRPPMNLIISNVPGPDRTKYLRGARLEALYPISLPGRGQALNITSISYAGQFNIGFTGARDNLPHLQRLAGYTADALAELEAALPQGSAPRRRGRANTDHRA